MAARIRPKLTEQVMLCRACDTYFRGLGNFDKHRRVVQGPPPAWLNGDLRQCVPPGAVGLHFYADKGYWGGVPMTPEQREKAKVGWRKGQTTPEKQSPLNSPGL